jgi:hypothetical protein
MVFISTCSGKYKLVVNTIVLEHTQVHGPPKNVVHSLRIFIKFLKKIQSKVQFIQLIKSTINSINQK